jgi:hypothetical protein
MTGHPPPPGAPPRIQRLLDEGGLEQLRPDPASIIGLWVKALNSDRDAREPGLSTDNRVGLAYQAGLQAVHAFLGAHGYRVRASRSHHYYSFYATQALAEGASDEIVQRDAAEMDRHRTRRAAAVYDAESATEHDLIDILGILDTLLPAIRDALLKRLPERAAEILPVGKHPIPASAAVRKASPQRH